MFFFAVKIHKFSDRIIPKFLNALFKLYLRLHYFICGAEKMDVLWTVSTKK